MRISYPPDLIPLFLVALAFYEYILTWQYEQSTVWHRKWTASTWLFLATRYLMLFSAVIQFTPYTLQVSNLPMLSPMTDKLI